MDKRNLFYGGILSLLLYLAADIIGGVLTPGYSFKEQAVSELMLVGSEYRMLVSALIFTSALAGIAFGVGIVLHFDHRRSRLLFFGGILFMVSALSTCLTSTIFPQDPIDGEVTFAGTMHLTLVGINVVISIVFILMFGIGLNKEFGWKAFRLYSIITLFIMGIFGVVSTVAVQNDVPILGVTERVSIYAFFVWAAVMAWLLLKKGTEPHLGEVPTGEGESGHSEDGTNSSL